jgi:beta-1,4-mannosyl-glycoprotein beta-1,4-N-acetylglucosaminyltransferase
MKIFDCTTFYNEKLMMDVRFNILNDYVSRFVVVESLFSHSGKKKKLNFDIKDYPKFRDKIKYIVIEKEPENLIQEKNAVENSAIKRSNSIKRIEQSYDYMLLGLENALDNDLIMLSDNDEIPNLETLDSTNLKNNFIIFEQLFFYYKFNLLYDRMTWFGTKACKKNKLKKLSSLRNLKNKRYPFWRVDTLFSEIKQMDLRIIKNGGWHFTNIKSAEDLLEKFENFGHHDEFEISNITVKILKEKIKNKEVFYNHTLDKTDKSKWNDNYKLKNIDRKLLPQYLNQNFNTYKEWFD